MKKLILVLLMLAFSVCVADSAYEAIQMDDTFDTVTARYGELIPAEEYLIADDAILCFYESGRLQAKGRVYESILDAASETVGSFAEVKKLKQGAPLEKLLAILGDGNEIMYINIADEENSGARRVLAWKNSDGNVLEALVERDNGGWILFAITEIEVNTLQKL